MNERRHLLFAALGLLAVAMFGAVAAALGGWLPNLTAWAADEAGIERHSLAEGHNEHSEEDHAHLAEEHDADADHNAAESGHDHSAEEGSHDHAHAEGEGLVALSAEERARVHLVVEAAETHPLSQNLTLPAEVSLNEDNVAHVVPRLAGIIVEVNVSIGDTVEAGQVLAVLESRELADAKAECLAAYARLALAEKTFAREKGLWEKGISAEADYLDATRDVQEARITVRAAEQKLQALGVSNGHSVTEQSEKGDSLTRYEVVAPFDGEVIEKHMTLGEYVESDREAFVIADLRSVWVDVNVFQTDLPRIAKGQAVTLSGPPGLPTAEGAISYIAPVVNRETRTALARIVLPNEGGMWRPGLFLDVQVSFPGEADALTVPASAVHRMGEQPVVFVAEDSGFRSQPVVIGRENGDRVEILQGLTPGQRYAAEGGFELKAKLVTEGMGSHAGHGH